MSLLPDIGAKKSTRSRKRATKGDTHAPNASSDIKTPKITSTAFTFTPDPAHTSTWPKWPASTTRATSDQRSERSETPVTLRDASYDHASSVTLQDEFPWHEVDAHKCSQKIPSTICPTLLLPASHLSPPSSKCGTHEDDTKSDTSDSDDALPRYSLEKKGKAKAQQDEEVVHDIENSSSQSPVDFQFSFNDDITVQEWFINNRPLLQDYADRQTSLPLGARLDVSIDEPSKFILGALQLLVNRDDPNRYVDPGRRLGPQLIENFVDIDRWAKEYFRYRHGAQVVDSDVTTVGSDEVLLTIVMNSFFEGQVQLIDRLVESAFSHMRIAGRSSLVLQDFAFGFDFRMSHDLPFYVETSSRIRKPDPIRAVELPSISEPVTTKSGRQVKPTPRAQAAAEDGQSNASPIPTRNTNTQLCNEQKARGRPKKGTTQPSGDPTVQDTSLTAKLGKAKPVPNKVTTAELERYRPACSSNLRETPVSPDPGVSHKPKNKPSLQAEEGPKSVTAKDTTKSDPVDNASDSATFKQAAQPPPRITIKLPAPRKRLPASMTTSAATIRDPESTSSNDTNKARTRTNAVETRTLRGGDVWRVQQEESGPRGLPLDGCGSGATALSAKTPKATPNATAAQLKSATPEDTGTDETAAPVERKRSVQPTIDGGPDSGAGAVTTTAATSTTAPTLAESGVQSHSATDNDGSLDALDDKRVAPQTVRTSKRKRPRTPSTLDPENSRRNKRQKLNEGEADRERENNLRSHVS